MPEMNQNPESNPVSPEVGAERRLSFEEAQRKLFGGATETTQENEAPVNPVESTDSLGRDDILAVRVGQIKIMVQDIDKSRENLRNLSSAERKKQIDAMVDAAYQHAIGVAAATNKSGGLDDAREKRIRDDVRRLKSLLLMPPDKYDAKVDTYVDRATQKKQSTTNTRKPKADRANSHESGSNNTDSSEEINPDQTIPPIDLSDHTGSHDTPEVSTGTSDPAEAPDVIPPIDLSAYETKSAQKDADSNQLEDATTTESSHLEGSNDETSAPEEAPIAVLPENSAELRDRINELSRAKQEAYVTLIGLPLYRFNERKAAKEALDRATNDYADALRAIGLEKIQEYTDSGDDKKTAFQKIADKFSETMQLDVNDERNLFVAKGGKRAKVLEWYSRQSIWKKVGIGVGSGAVLAGGGLLAGAAGLGVGLATVAGGGIVTGRVTKVYLASLSRLYGDTLHNAPKMDFQNPDMLDNEQAADLLKAYVVRETNEREKDAYKTRLKAVGWAIGSLATGATLATVGATTSAGEWQGIRFWRNPADANLSTRGMFSVNESESSIGADERVVHRPHEEGPPFGGVDEHDRTPPNTPENTGNEPEQQHDPIADHIDAHEAGTTVQSGEGWYQTFKEFGVSSEYQAELLQKVGPKLEEMGEAYRMDDGLWGISRPGELSDEASRLIVGTANEHGWLSTSLETDGVEGVVENIPAALEKVKPGEGILRSLQDAGVESPSLNDVTAIQDQLVQDGVAYANGPDGYAGLNLPENGTMDTAGIETFMDYADNGKLDDSAAVINTEQHTVGIGENAVDYKELHGVAEAAEDHLTYLERTSLATQIHEFSDLLKLNTNEAIEKINLDHDAQNAMKYVAADIKDIYYPGTDVPVITQNFSLTGGEWKFNPIPGNSYVPAKVVNTLIAYEQTRFGLAA